MLANAIGMRCYGEDEFRRHGKVTGGEQMGGKEERRRRVLLFIARKDASSFASSRRGRHGDGNVSPCEEAAKTVGGKQLSGEQEVAPCSILIFEIFTELPLSSFYKLLPNFLKKLKISKNKSCSTFQVLQLCLNGHFQILPPF